HSGSPRATPARLHGQRAITMVRTFQRTRTRQASPDAPYPHDYFAALVYGARFALNSSSQPASLISIGACRGNTCTQQPHKKIITNEQAEVSPAGVANRSL